MQVYYFQAAPELTTYTINQKPIANIEEYGSHIEALCRGMPSYTAMEMPRKLMYLIIPDYNGMGGL